MSDRRALGSGGPLEPPRIDRRPPSTPGLDVEALRDEGLAHLRALAGRTWTDHNVHDPGITLLEAIAYGFTDLAYRATAETVDLLAGADDGFFSAPEMLPCAPVTAADLRRLMLDVPGVRDAEVRAYDPQDDRRPRGEVPLYVEPRRCALTTEAPTDDGQGRLPVEVEGRLVVELELEPAVDGDPARRRPVVEAARAAFFGARPLSTDLVAIRRRPIHPIRVCADLELAPGTDPDAARAAALWAVDRLLRVPAGFRSLAEALAAGQTIEALFTGPLPRHGFVDPAALAPPPRVIHASDLYRAMLTAPGVRAVTRLRVVRVGVDGGVAEVDETLGDEAADAEAWRTAVPPGHAPRLHAEGSVLRCFARGVPLDGRRDAVLAGLAALRARDERPRLPAHVPTPPRPTGEAPEGGGFASLQGLLPSVYGVGPHPLPPEVSDARRGRAAQLQAYLLVFDQLRADAAAQLAAMPRLLSCRAPEVERSRFAGSCAAAPGAAYLLAAGPAAIAALLEGPDADRRARIDARLDHLLARFGDGFGPDERALRPAGASDEALRDKALLLRELAATSHDRGRGVDLAGGASPTTAIARRLVARLGLSRGELALRAELVGRRCQLFRDALGDWRFRFVYVDGDIVLRSARAFPTAGEAWRAVEATVTRLSLGAGALTLLDPGPTRQHHGFAVFGADGRALAYSTDHFDADGRARAIERVFEAAVDELAETGRPDPVLPGELHVEAFVDRGGGHRFRVVHRLRDTLLTAPRGWETEAGLDAAIEEVVRLGSAPAHYTVEAFSGGFRLRLRRPAAEGRPVEPDDPLVGRGTDLFATRAEAEARRDELARALADALDEAEPVVIEHLLLRPRRVGAGVLPHGRCVGPDVPGGCRVDDPYSHRLTVLLPAWPTQFADLRRRAAAEQIARREAPAHLAVRICWVDRRTAFIVRRAWHRWLRAAHVALFSDDMGGDGIPSDVFDAIGDDFPDGTPPALAAREAARDEAAALLVAQLARVRSVYPGIRLHDCRDPDPRGPARLDHSRLGTLHAHREE